MLLEGPDDGRVVGGFVQPVLDGPGRDITTGHGEAVVVGDGPFVHLEEVHGGQAQIGDGGAERLQGDARKAPARNGLGDAGLGGESKARFAIDVPAGTNPACGWSRRAHLPIDSPAGAPGDQPQRGGSGCLEGLTTCKVRHSETHSWR